LLKKLSTHRKSRDCLPRRQLSVCHAFQPWKSWPVSTKTSLLRCSRRSSLHSSASRLTWRASPQNWKHSATQRRVSLSSQRQPDRLRTHPRSLRLPLPHGLFLLQCQQLLHRLRPPQRREFPERPAGWSR
jgi:hypothetical protein